MGFNDFLVQLRQSKTREVTAPASWTQGRALFGGLVAGLLYQGMRLEVDAERLLRSFSITFVGPVAAEVPLQIDVRVLREGRAVTQVQAHAIQGDEVMAVAMASFGAGRESALDLPAMDAAPQVAGPEDCEELPFREGRSVEFARNFNWRWAIGGLPYTGISQREMGGWIQFKDPQPETKEAQLLALIDAWPPAVLPLLTPEQLAPASTLTWSVDFIQPLPDLSADDWILYRAVVDHVRDGYNQASANIWDQSGQLIALSRQTVVVFA